MLWYSDRSLPPAYSFVARLNWVAALQLARLMLRRAEERSRHQSASRAGATGGYHRPMDALWGFVGVVFGSVVTGILTILAG